VIAVEVIGPTPGIVINRRAVGSDFERWLISASNAAICAFNTDLRRFPDTSVGSISAT
jgi:hypothetical protein